MIAGIRFTSILGSFYEGVGEQAAKGRTEETREFGCFRLFEAARNQTDLLYGKQDGLQPLWDRIVLVDQSKSAIFKHPHMLNSQVPRPLHMPLSDCLAPSLTGMRCSVNGLSSPPHA